MQGRASSKLLSKYTSRNMLIKNTIYKVQDQGEVSQLLGSLHFSINLHSFLPKYVTNRPSFVLLPAERKGEGYGFNV